MNRRTLLTGLFGLGIAPRAIAGRPAPVAIGIITITTGATNAAEIADGLTLPVTRGLPLSVLDLTECVRRPGESTDEFEVRLWAEAERVRLINLPAIEARRKAYRKAAT